MTFDLDDRNYLYVISKPFALERFLKPWYKPFYLDRMVFENE